MTLLLFGFHGSFDVLFKKTWLERHGSLVVADGWRSQSHLEEELGVGGERVGGDVKVVQWHGDAVHLATRHEHVRR